MAPESLFSSLPPEVLEEVFHHAFDGIAISEQGKIIYVNAGLAAMCGFSAEEMMGRQTADFAAPGDSARKVRESSVSGETNSYIATSVRKDGKVVHGEVRSYPYSWKGRQFRLTALRDITARVEAETKLRESEQRFRTIIESAEEGIWQVGADYKTVFVNPKMAALLGYSPEAMIGRDVLSFVSEELRAEVGARIASRKAGMKGQYDIRYRHKDGSQVWMINSVAPLLGADGSFQGALGFHTDLTERRRAEDKLAELRSQMLFSTKATALGEIANGIAHEINNPLSVIRAYTDVLRDGIQGIEISRGIELKQEQLRLVEYADKIDSTVTRITQIVRSLVVFTQDADREPFQKIRVSSLIQDALSLCESRLRNSRIELKQGPVPEAAELECRPVPMSQVLLNLLHNAVDAVEAAPSKWVRVSVEELDDEVVIAVEDSGSGIPLESRGKIMRAFYTTKPPHRGTGLGLAISRKIVESHHGSLGLDASADRTRFVVRLPKRQGH